MSKLVKSHFLEKYRVSEKDFKSTKLKWRELVRIFDDHISHQKEYQTISNYIFDLFNGVDSVHSIRRRIKDPEHLIEKIIRKSLEDTSLKIEFDNYKQYITDLIGVRVLHLFKDEWIQIHNKIIDIWKTIEKPTANIRKGDIEDIYIENGCAIKEHKFGYRSVHYLIEFPYSKDVKRTVEIQVRTVFEEAWSEIDHKIRYPYDINNPILAGYLVVFNGLAGSADQMGSFIKLLKNDLDERNKQIEEKDRVIKELKDEIGKSKLDKPDKERMTKTLNKIIGDSLLKSVTSLKLLPDVFKLPDTLLAVQRLNDSYKTIFNQTYFYPNLSNKITSILNKQKDEPMMLESEVTNVADEEIKNEEFINQDDNDKHDKDEKDHDSGNAGESI